MTPDRKSRIGLMQQIQPKGKGVPQPGGINWRGWVILLGALWVLGAPGSAYSAGPPNPPDAFQICPRPGTTDTDRYALCATAQCFVLNGLAYCSCDVAYSGHPDRSVRPIVITCSADRDRSSEQSDDTRLSLVYVLLASGKSPLGGIPR